jgi:hypothetical protein
MSFTLESRKRNEANAARAVLYIAPSSSHVEKRPLNDSTTCPSVMNYKAVT